MELNLPDIDQSQKKLMKQLLQGSQVRFLQEVY